MERTEELFSASRVFLPVGGAASAPELRGPSGLTFDCKRVLADIKINEEILGKISKLASQREYSNDPSTEITKKSETFQRQVVVIQRALDQLKCQISQFKSNSLQGRHHRLHYEIIQETLQKQVATQTSTFQGLMKRHFEHVEQRKQRVVKYGQTDTSLGIPSATGSGAETRSYAMFSGNKMSGTPLPAAGPSELRRRAPTGCTHSNKKNNFNNSNNDYSHGIGQPSNRTGFGSEGGSNLSNATPYQISAQEIRKNALARQQNADSIEAIVSKMGGLFSQMASLIVEQGETITRIEDDIEIGHQQTTEAHESMQYFYDITKGNRSMIFKIFGLLIFFIFLFLVWLR